MNNHFKGIVLAAFLSPLVLLFAAPLALAQTPAPGSAGIEIKPAVVEDNVDPGTVKQYSFTVTNVSSSQKTLFLNVQDIQGEDDSGRPIFSTTGQTTGYELSSWITLPETSIDLGPGQSQAVNFTVTIPAKASPGSHFAGVFFNNKPVAPTTSGSGVGFNVGAIVSLRISGDIVEEANLQEFSTDKLIYPSANVNFTTKINNTGNTLVQPTGVIQITNMLGKQVANIAVNTNQASVFPQATRTYTANWTDGGFAFGRYEVVGSFVYGQDERKTISATTSFWVLPLVPIGIALAVILVLVLGVYFMMKSYIRKKLRQMGVSTASRADTDLYQRRYQKSGSRMIVTALIVVLVCVVILMALFLLFA